MNEKKGAVPLDTGIEAGVGDGRQDEVAGKADPIEESNAFMAQMLAHAMMLVRRNKITGLCVAFIDENAMPQHGFSLRPYTARSLFAGMTLATDAVKKAMVDEVGRYHVSIEEAAAKAAANPQGKPESVN